MTDDLKHWILDNPKALGGDVAGLRTPDAATALVIDGFATSNGKKFDFPPFGAGRMDITLMVLPAEVGNRMYEKMAGYVASRKSRTENLSDENEVLAAKWDIDGDTVAVMAADSIHSLVENAQDTFEQYLGFERIQIHSSRLSAIGPAFDARKWLEKPGSSPKIRNVIEALALPVSAPSPARGPRP